MKYLMFKDVNNKPAAMTRTVPKKDAAYLKKTVVPKMRALSDDEYLYGPGAILQTPAKYSYILDGKAVYWCVDWAPGLLVLQFSVDGAMKFAALRRIDSDEEDGESQYNLIYDAWDAQFEEETGPGWAAAAPADLKAHAAALHHSGTLHERVYKECLPKKSYDSYFKKCEKSPIWKGTIVMD